MIVNVYSLWTRITLLPLSPDKLWSKRVRRDFIYRYLQELIWTDMISLLVTLWKLQLFLAIYFFFQSERNSMWLEYITKITESDCFHKSDRSVKHPDQCRKLLSINLTLIRTCKFYLLSLKKNHSEPNI